MTIKEQGEFQYIDEGQGEVVILLHGLMGALSNWEETVSVLKKDRRVLIPLLPIYTISLPKAGIKGLTSYVEKFVKELSLDNFILIGNSLGGHIGLNFTLNNPEKVTKLVLTGSSGLYEDTMKGGYPKRGDYEFVRVKTQYTFYDPTIATKELIDDVFEVTNTNASVLRIISFARSAQKNNMAKELVNITIPTLLIWGLNDTITPPFVAHEFNKLIKNSELHFIDKCCHAPMMEQPKRFNEILAKYINK